MINIPRKVKRSTNARPNALISDNESFLIRLLKKYLLQLLVETQITVDGDCCHDIKRRVLLVKASYDQPREHITKQRHYFANKGPSGQGYGFSSGHVWM